MLASTTDNYARDSLRWVIGISFRCGQKINWANSDITFGFRIVVADHLQFHLLSTLRVEGQSAAEQRVKMR